MYFLWAAPCELLIKYPVNIHVWFQVHVMRWKYLILVSGNIPQSSSKYMLIMQSCRFGIKLRVINHIPQILFHCRIGISETPRYILNCVILLGNWISFRKRSRRVVTIRYGLSGQPAVLVTWERWTSFVQSGDAALLDRVGAKDTGFGGGVEGWVCKSGRLSLRYWRVGDILYFTISEFILVLNHRTTHAHSFAKLGFGIW